MNDLSFRLGDRERYFADQADRDLRHEMKSRLRILQFSLSSFFVIVTLVAILVPLARNLFHSNYEISADLLGPLRGRSNSHTPRKASDIKLLIETHTEFRDKLVPPGSSNISVHVREHDNYVDPLYKVPLLGWTEHHHTIFRCKIIGFDPTGNPFSTIRFVDEHFYYCRDDLDSESDLPRRKTVK